MPKRKTTEEYKNEVESITNNEYTILSEYKTQNDKILFKHLKCGREYLTTPKNFNRGRRCSHCNNNKKPKTTEEFSKEVNELTNGEYILVSEYGLNNKEKVTIKHLKCNKEFKIQPYNFSNGNRCPFCYKVNNRKTTEEFSKEVTELTNGEYKVIGDYLYNNIPIEIFHNKCKKSYKVQPIKFLSGRRCPFCKESEGEYKIRKFLEDNNISYQKEFKFKDLYDKKYLRFDFKLDYEDGGILLIEYDGIQHFQKGWYDNNEDLLLRKKHDKMKDDYCKKNNIDLIRISYKDFDNIENILKEELTFND